MSDWIDNESFWAVVALFIFWLKIGSSRASNTILTVPEWLVIWALTGIVEPDSSSTTFALFGGWVDGPWGIALTFTALGGGAEFGASGAFSALFGDGIEKLSSSSVTLDTIVRDLIITILAF